MTFQSDHFVLLTNFLFKFNVSLPLVTGELLQNTVDDNNVTYKLYNIKLQRLPVLLNTKNYLSTWYMDRIYGLSRDCNAVYVGETGRSVRTRKREHVDAVKTFNTKKSALSQHVMEFDHRIDWDNVKILKSESHAYRRRVAESFLINHKACSCNVINRNDGANFPTVYSVFVSNK